MNRNGLVLSTATKPTASTSMRADHGQQASGPGYCLIEASMDTIETFHFDDEQQADNCPVRPRQRCAISDPPL
jgi:hypothetical protein